MSIVVPLVSQELSFEQEEVSLPWIPPSDHFRVLFVHCDFQKNERLRENTDQQRRRLDNLVTCLNTAPSRIFHKDYASMEVVDLNPVNERDRGENIEEKLRQFVGANKKFDLIHVCTHGSQNGLYLKDALLDPLLYCEDVLKRFAADQGAVLVLACCDSANLGSKLATTDRFYAVFGTRDVLSPKTALGFCEGLYEHIARSWTLGEKLDKCLVKACLRVGLEHGRSKCEATEKLIWTLQGNSKCSRRPFVKLCRQLSSHYRVFPKTFFVEPEFRSGDFAIKSCIESNERTIILREEVGNYFESTALSLLRQSDCGWSLGDWIGYCFHVEKNSSTNAKLAGWLEEHFDVVMAVSIAELEEAKMSLDGVLENVFCIPSHDCDGIVRELKGYSSRVLWVIDARHVNQASKIQERILMHFSRDRDANLSWIGQCILITNAVLHEKCIVMEAPKSMTVHMATQTRMENVQMIHKTWDAMMTPQEENVKKAARIGSSESLTANAWANLVQKMRKEFDENSLLLFRDVRHDVTSGRIPYIPLCLKADDVGYVHKDSKIDLSELMSDCRHVILEGVAGSGKSTVVRQIFQLWLQKQAFFQFHLIIPISFNALSCLSDWDPETVLGRVVKAPRPLIEAVRGGDIRILFILDGLDEVVRTDKFVKSFLLPLCLKGLKWMGDVIVTTRPGHTDSLWKEWRRVLLKGFDETGKDLYIDHFFADRLLAERKKVKALVNQTSLKSLTGDPLMLQLVCLCFYDAGVERHDSMTLLFDHAFEHMLQRYCQIDSKDWEGYFGAWMNGMADLASQQELLSAGVSEQSVLQCCEKWRSRFGCRCSAKDLFRYSVELGILRRDKDMEYTFAHQMVKEFFFAHYLAQTFRVSSNARIVLSKLFASGDSLNNVAVLLRFLSEVLLQKLKDFASLAVICDLIIQHVPSPAHCLVANNLIVIIDEMIKQKKWFKLLEENSSKQPLIFSCDIVSTMKFLLDRGIDKEAKNELGMTRLHLACVRQEVEMVNFLIGEGAQVNAMDTDGVTPLEWACTFSTVAIVRLLLAKQAKCRGHTPLYRACMHIDHVHRLKMVKFLVEEQRQHVVVNGKMYEDEDGVNIFHLACLRGDVDLMRYLHQHKASIGLCDKIGKSPMHFAAKSGSLNAVKFLFDCFKNKSQVDRKGRLPVHFACKSGALDVISFFQNDICVAAADGKNCLHFAAKKDRLLALKYLIGLKTLDTNDRDRSKRTPIQYAKSSEVKSFLEECAALQTNTRAQGVHLDAHDFEQDVDFEERPKKTSRK